MSIYYIGSYVDEKHGMIYEASVPGSIKMNYILSKIKEVTNEHVVICSFAMKNRFFYFNQRIQSVGNTDILFLMGCGVNNKCGRAFDRFLKRIAFRKLLKNVRKEDTVIIYHSGWTQFLKNICKKNGVKTILEVEEIYAYSDYEDKNVGEEIDTINGFDSYIFINDYIPKSLNIVKPYAVCYGVVKQDVLKNDTVDNFGDGKKHIVYAGAISLERQGAYTALEAARFLTNNYVLHILGTGSKEAIELLKKYIKDINSQNIACKVEYDGFLSGDALYNFMKKCDIGLSTYNLRPNFSNNSLPSKVLSYMSCGLNVVIGYTSAFELMPISKYWTFYYEQSSSSIANSILKIKEINRQAMYEYLVEADNNVTHFLKKQLNV